jgi:hypothetical protein
MDKKNKNQLIEYIFWFVTLIAIGLVFDGTFAAADIGTINGTINFNTVFYNNGTDCYYIFNSTQYSCNNNSVSMIQFNYSVPYNTSYLLYYSNISNQTFQVLNTSELNISCTSNNTDTILSWMVMNFPSLMNSATAPIWNNLGLRIDNLQMNMANQNTINQLNTTLIQCYANKDQSDYKYNLANDTMQQQQIFIYFILATAIVIIGFALYSNYKLKKPLGGG